MTIVLYHSADFDGIFCREIAKMFLSSATKFIGWNYNDPVPDVSIEDTIYMLDISIEGLMNHPNLIWIDHHVSAMNKFDPQIRGWRIDGVAACRLVWQWFDCFEDVTKLLTAQDFIDRKVSEPWAVRLAGEHDIWDHRDPDAETFQHGLRSRDLSAEHWAKMLGNNAQLMEELLRHGLILQESRRKESALLVSKTAHDVWFEGHLFLALNAAMVNSIVFTSGIRPDHDGCLSYYFEGKLWKVSMYGVPGKPDIDFSKIAARHGGGGHKQACGFAVHRISKVIGHE